jgi:hypothetical protein
MSDFENDAAEIRALAKRLICALSWSPDADADWATFRAAFHPSALLVPAARPSAPIDVETFIGRMQKQRADGSLLDFEEGEVSIHVDVFGNVASAFQVYSTRINRGALGYGTSALSFVKDEAGWRCIFMAWDSQNDSKRIPAKYL